MSHISTGVEYALHCLLFLADLPADAPEASAKDLAELQGIPGEYAAKLFTKLNKAGLVAASEGVKGGFALARRRSTSACSMWSMRSMARSPCLNAAKSARAARCLAMPRRAGRPRACVRSTP